MSKKRQPSLSLEDRLDIRSLAVDYPSGYRTHSHSHVWHQLIYASRGVMTVNTQAGSWVVPAKRAVWIPANVVHEVVMHGLVSMRTLYIRDRISSVLPSQCAVVNVSPLLRELIVHSTEIGMLDRTQPAHKHLIDVLLDQLETINSIPLQLPMPADPRAARLAELLRQSPSETRPLHELAHVVGASKRTIERAFVVDVNMTFGKWRQQLRLLSALRLLAEGQSVTAIALEVVTTARARLSPLSRICSAQPQAVTTVNRSDLASLNYLDVCHVLVETFAHGRQASSTWHLARYRHTRSA